MNNVVADLILNQKSIFTFGKYELLTSPNYCLSSTTCGVLDYYANANELDGDVIMSRNTIRKK